MIDIVDTKRRSEMMAGINGRDTAPERKVRSIAHGMGLRFRLCRKDLPGRPDLVFAKHRLVVFVHGCFWHRHEGCQKTSTPKSRTSFWIEKFAANVDRDARQQAALKALGWRVLIIWQCETKDEAAVERGLAAVTKRDRTTADRGEALSVEIAKHKTAPERMDRPTNLYPVPNWLKSGLSAARTVEDGFSQ